MIYDFKKLLCKKSIQGFKIEKKIGEFVSLDVEQNNQS